VCWLDVILTAVLRSMENTCQPIDLHGLLRMVKYRKICGCFTSATTAAVSIRIIYLLARPRLHPKG
jgi:hypothetical protein